jgi:hypothetical protein
MGPAVLAAFSFLRVFETTTIFPSFCNEQLATKIQINGSSTAYTHVGLAGIMDSPLWMFAYEFC